MRTAGGHRVERTQPVDDHSIEHLRVAKDRPVETPLNRVNGVRTRAASAAADSRFTDLRRFTGVAANDPADLW